MATQVKDTRFERVMKEWEESERGTGGLRKIRFSGFQDIAAKEKVELLKEPTILTADGEEIMVVMTVEDYFARLPVTQGPPGRTPQMARLNGRLFREVF